MPSAPQPKAGAISSPSSPAEAHAHFCPQCRLQKAEMAQSHDAILQLLDRRVGKLNFNKEPFIPTVDRWSGIPLVFAKKHLDPLKEVAEAELSRVNGAIIGDLADPEIEMSGKPKLIAKKMYSIEPAQRMFDAGLISQDTLDRSIAAVPIALKLLEEGKLSHSTAFMCPDNGDSLYGEVSPHHVLDFEETPTDQPVDRGAVILNKQEIENVTDQKPHTNIGKVLSSKNEGRLKSAFDSIKSIFDEIVGNADGGETTPKTNAMMTDAGNAIAVGTMNTPDCESLEGQIENVRRALSESINLKYPDGSPRNVWSVMTLPDQVIWQHPDTSKYYSTPYTMQGDVVTFDSPVEVEQAYVVKQAGTVITNMTAEDLNTIAKRNKMVEAKPEIDAKIAQLQKEKDDLAASKDIEIAQLQKERDELVAAKAQVQKEKFDTEWAGLKASVIPPGEVKDPADEAKLQKMSVDEPLAFAAKVAGWKSAPKMGAEGQVHTNGPTDDKSAETLATLRELRSSTGRMKR